MGKRFLLFSLVLTVVTFFFGCGGGGTSRPDPAPPVSISITPTTTNLLVGTSAKFTATVAGHTNTAVNYMVVQGASGGQILNTGDYLAPKTPGVYTVRASSVADPSKYADAAVTVRDYSGNFTPVTPPDGYDYHTASLLNDGSVLIVGGKGFKEAVHRQAIRYVPSTNSYQADANLSLARIEHAALRLASGKVVVAGGWDPTAPGTPFDPVYKSTEIYDPETRSFSAGPDMTFPRRDHIATQLQDGRFLITGGLGLRGSGFGANPGTEIYDPVANTFVASGRMSSGRWLHTATLLADGRVLIVGGRDNNCPDGSTCRVYSLASAEIFDPITGTFTPTGSLNISRWGHSATLLPNGRVLILGGESTDLENTDRTGVAEVYDPAIGQFTPWTSLGEGRGFHTVTALNNGKLLVAGGFRATVIATSSTEYFDPTTGAVTAGPNMYEFHARHTATKLSNGEVFIFGGTYSVAPATAAEIFR